MYKASSSCGTVSIGTNPYNFVTRKTSMYMEKIGDELYQIMNNNKDVLKLSGVGTNTKLNHCTVFL